VAHAVGQRAGVGHAVVACNVANVPHLDLSVLMCRATFVIVQVIVPAMVTGRVDDDDHPPQIVVQLLRKICLITNEKCLKDTRNGEPSGPSPYLTDFCALLYNPLHLKT